MAFDADLDLHLTDSMLNWFESDSQLFDEPGSHPTASTLSPIENDFILSLLNNQTESSNEFSPQPELEGPPRKRKRTNSEDVSPMNGIFFTIFLEDHSRYFNFDDIQLIEQSLL